MDQVLDKKMDNILREIDGIEEHINELNDKNNKILENYEMMLKLVIEEFHKACIILFNKN